MNKNEKYIIMSDENYVENYIKGKRTNLKDSITGEGKNKIKLWLQRKDKLQSTKTNNEKERLIKLAQRYNVKTKTGSNSIGNRGQNRASARRNNNIGQTRINTQTQTQATVTAGGKNEEAGGLLNTFKVAFGMKKSSASKNNGSQSYASVSKINNINE